MEADLGVAEDATPAMTSETESKAKSSGLDLYISLCFLLITIVGLVFMQTRRFAFVWDDVVNVAGNRHMSPVTSETYRYFWENPYLSLYIPLTYTVLAIQADYAGKPTPEPGVYQFDPTVFHTTNLAMHLACVVLVFTLLRMLIKHDGGAFFGALLFGLHPLQVETASWVTETKGLLATSLGLLAIWLYLLFARRGEEEAGEQPIGALGVLQVTLATIAYTLSLLAKPSAVVIPLLAVALQWGFFGSLKRRHWATMVIWMIPTIAIALITRSVQTAEDEPTFEAAPLWFRPFLVGFTIAFYVYKLFVPLWLTADYGLTPTTVMHMVWGYVAWLIPAVLLVFMITLPNRRIWLTATAVFVLGMLPVIGLVPFGFQLTSTVADRYAYLSMLGPAVALAFFLSRHWSTTPIVAAATVVLAMLGWLSFEQAKHWRDQRTLFEYVLTVNPDSIQAHHNIAQLYASKGEIKTAFEHLQRIIELRPNNWRAHADFAVGYAEMGKYPEAESHARQSLEVNPKNASVLAALGFSLAQQGKVSEAKTAYESALALEPNMPRALDGLGDALVRQGQPEEGIKLLLQAIELKPDDANAHYHLGNAYDRKGMIKESLEHYRKAMSLDPKRLPGAIDVAWQLATNPDPSIRNGAEAFRLATQVQDMMTNPTAQVFDTLAAAKAEMGDFKEADQLALKALAVATQTGDIELQYRIKVRIAYYRNGRPYHQGPERPRRQEASPSPPTNDVEPSGNEP